MGSPSTDHGARERSPEHYPPVELPEDEDRRLGMQPAWNFAYFARDFGRSDVPSPVSVAVDAARAF